MESLWQLWRQGFTQWEQATAKLLETALKSPALLEPSGQALSSFMRGKKQLDELSASFLTAFGLPIRRDQERMLHLLNQLQSRLIDLEERIEDRLSEMEERLSRAGVSAAPPFSEGDVSGAPAPLAPAAATTNKGPEGDA